MENDEEIEPQIKHTIWIIVYGDLGQRYEWVNINREGGKE